MKGMDWLIESIHSLNAEGFSFRVAFFGRGQIAEHLDQSIESVSLGGFDSPELLSEVYNCADLMLVPSRLESFGQTASEAQACGIPVVSFDSSGLRDIVVHKETGYRAKCYETGDLATGIRWCLSDSDRRIQMGIAAAKRSKELFDIKNVARQYASLYSKVLG
jgi:glycosyltransferase involved in cell wall biosynthesis